ncbi:hypothetical protein BC940DRAFT_313482 [Gongronella butleri]|nr:hypothetical protein BC940DRAFT_313482 [Gongronella butleri]
MAIATNTKATTIRECINDPSKLPTKAPRTHMIVKALAAIPPWATDDARSILEAKEGKATPLTSTKPSIVRHLLHSKAEWIHRPARKPPEAETQQFWRISTMGWKRIFQARILHKALEIWYRTLHGKLPTRDRLVKLNIAGVESEFVPDLQDQQ